MDIPGGRSLIPVSDLCTRLSDINVLTVFHIIGRITIAEAIYKNLIHDCTLCPLRRRKSRYDSKGVVVFSVIRYTISVVIPDLLAFFYLNE